MTPEETPEARANRFFQHIWDSEYSPTIRAALQSGHGIEQLTAFEYNPTHDPVWWRRLRTVSVVTVSTVLSFVLFVVVLPPSDPQIADMICNVLGVPSLSYVLSHHLFRWLPSPMRSGPLTLRVLPSGVCERYEEECLTFTDLVDKYPGLDLADYLRPFKNLVADLKKDLPTETQTSTPLSTSHKAIAQLNALEDGYMEKTRTAVESLKAYEEVSNV